MKRSLDITLDLISQKTAKLVDLLIILSFTVLIVSCVVQVLSRYVVNRSLPWTEELARYSFMYVNIVGAAVCIRKKSHARIAVVLDTVGPGARLVLEVFSDIVTVFVACIMIYYGSLCAVQVSSQLSPAMRICMSAVYVCVPIAGVCFLLEALFSLLRDLRALTRGEA